LYEDVHVPSWSPPEADRAKKFSVTASYYFSFEPSITVCRRSLQRIREAPTSSLTAYSRSYVTMMDAIALARNGDHPLFDMSRDALRTFRRTRGTGSNSENTPACDQSRPFCRLPGDAGAIGADRGSIRAEMMLSAEPTARNPNTLGLRNARSCGQRPHPRALSARPR